ncbi:MAG: hypothetical protein WDN31_05240 [Hyphomicrobium sp.]
MTILDEYLPREQLAKDMNVTVRTLDRWARAPDGLPFTKIGGRIFFRIASVRAWLAARERAPNPTRKGA